MSMAVLAGMDEHECENCATGGLFDLMCQAWQWRVGAWGNETFPDATHGMKLGHLEEEFREVLDAETAEEFVAECADVLLMMLHCCHSLRLSLFGEAQRKFQVLRDSQWRLDPKLGYYKRVKGSEGDQPPVTSRQTEDVVADLKARIRDLEAELAEARAGLDAAQDAAWDRSERD